MFDKKDTTLFDESDVIVRTRKYDAYAVPNAITEGQIAFVPKNDKWQDLRDCFEAAYKWGYDWVDKNYCQSFHVVQNVGISDTNLVYLIPRKDNDTIDLEKVKTFFNC